MSPPEPSRRTRPTLTALLACALVAASTARAEEGPASKKESPLVRMLKAGKLPEERQRAVVEMIGKRGSAADLGYLFERVLADDGLSPPLRAKALDALTDAALTRGVRPPGDLTRVGRLVAEGADPASRVAAVGLAGLWKVEALGPALGDLAGSAATPADLRAAALDALAALGGDANRARIEALAGPGRPVPVRVPAVAALARLDAGRAAKAAGGVLVEAKEGDDLAPMVAAFLNRQGGGDTLARVVAEVRVPPDAAKLALRAVYALGRSDPALVAALTKAAGVEAEVKPLDPAAMAGLVADVAAKGDPARGEAVFRRADVNCAKCHALSGAGGGVGPDLSAVGASSPVDYLVNAILLPDQAIKEEFQTLVVLTADGQVFHGVVADRDDRRIVLKEATGALRTVPASDVEETKVGGSLMPKGLVNFLTRAEFVDLVRFLSELGKPGPYAVRSAPTVQRWRYLKPVPAPLAASVPDLGAFRSGVRDADPARWLPAYARTAGDLPLDELVASAGSDVLYLRAEVEVSRGGALDVTLNRADGVCAWVDAAPAPAPSGASFPADLTPGRHTLTFRVNVKARHGAPLRVEIRKPAGSSAEYAVVGGP